MDRLDIDRLRTAVNVAIVFAIAAAVAFLPGGGQAANTFSAALSVLFAGGLAYFAMQLYREHRVGVYGIGHRRRALLYGALAVGVVTLAAQKRMWESELGELAWFVLVALVLYVLFALYRFARSY
jgi:hypothetical protein